MPRRVSEIPAADKRQVGASRLRSFRQHEPELFETRFCIHVGHQTAHSSAGPHSPILAPHLCLRSDAAISKYSSDLSPRPETKSALRLWFALDFLQALEWGRSPDPATPHTNTIECKSGGEPTTS